MNPFFEGSDPLFLRLLIKKDNPFAASEASLPPPPCCVAFSNSLRETRFCGVVVEDDAKYE
jgi:hypothetical protein